jgi:cytochrome c peroxidase
VETYNINGKAIDLTGAFFQSLGTNGRSCSSCHLPSEGWSVSASEVRLRFLLTRGRDPIFRTNDGSNCDHGLNTATLEERRAAYSLLLSKGLIRISLPVPANAEFRVVSVQNPYRVQRDANAFHSLHPAFCMPLSRGSCPLPSYCSTFF